MKLRAPFQRHGYIQTGVTVRKCSIWVKIGGFCGPCDLEIWQMTLKNNRTPPLYYVKFVHHFQAICEFKLDLQPRNAQSQSKSAIFLFRVTLKFNGRPSETIGHLFCAASSFVHHFIAISEFKLGLQSGNAQFGSKLAIFWPVWPWNLTDDLENQ